MELTLPLKDISTPILLGYVAELENKPIRDEKDLQFRKDLKAELEARGTNARWGIFDKLIPNE